jgi:[ribosomal protein S18]-alanine N-acetyltransferase
LLEHLVERARSEGARVLYLEVRPSNRPALALYRRADFIRIGVRKSYYRAENGREDALVFARAL